MGGPAAETLGVEATDETGTDHIDIKGIIQSGSIEKMDYYPRDKILRVRVQAQEPVEVLVDDTKLRSVLDTARSRGIMCKFAPHVHTSSLTGGTEDDDWVFLRKQLEPVLVQMRPYFRHVYEEPPQPNELLGEASRHHAATTLVAEATAEIISAMRTASAKKLVAQYQARVQVLLAREVQDVFLSCAAR